MERYYLLGSPVAHSLSPAMMNYTFQKNGLDAKYEVIDTDETMLPEVVHELRAGRAAGWNVTMPVKHAMYALCDELSAESRIGKSVNTVLNRGGKLYGYTTDGAGLMAALQRAGEPVAGKKIVLLGTGGAASAILIRAALDQAGEIAVFANRPSSAVHVRQIAEELLPLSETRIRICSYEDPSVLREELQDSRILIQATNVGMEHTEKEAACLIPDSSFLHRDLYVYDIIYHPKETPLLKMAREAGLRAENGCSMLIGQGAESFRIWTGCDMPVDEVRALLF